MKRRTMISAAFFAIASLFLPSGCTSSSNNKEEDASSASPDEPKNTSAGSGFPENTSGFNKMFLSYTVDLITAFNNNRIDADYLKELKTAVTTIDYTELFKKYIQIWKDEMEFSVLNIKTALDGKANEAFDEAQRNWEDYTNSNIFFLRKNLSREWFGRELSLRLGGYELDTYKERTLEIKYLHYNFERQKAFENGESMKNYKSKDALKFEYQGF